MLNYTKCKMTTWALRSKLSRRKKSDFPHDVHWDAVGCRGAADAVETFLRQQGIFHGDSTPDDETKSSIISIPLVI